MNASDEVTLLCQQATSLLVNKRAQEAYRLLAPHQQRYSGDIGFLGLFNLALQQVMPRWHYLMLRDEARNRFYENAIAAAVKPGDVVLDIGTGSGLLSMMAVRAGASHVYTCEENPVIAELACQVIAQNGMSDQITVLSAHSTRLEVGRDLPERADVLVTETFSELIAGEGVLLALNHARQTLLKPGAAVVPETAELLAVPYQYDNPRENISLPDKAEISGFNLSAFNGFSARAAALIPFKRTPEQPEVPGGCALSTESAVILRCDFTAQSMASLSDRLQIEMDMQKDGLLNAVNIHMRLRSHGFEYDVSEIRNGGHWDEKFLSLQDALPVRAGDRISLDLWYSFVPQVAFYGRAAMAD